MADDQRSTILPWWRGKPVAWDVTVAYTYADWRPCQQHSQRREAGATQRDSYNNWHRRCNNMSRV